MKLNDDSIIPSVLGIDGTLVEPTLTKAVMTDVTVGADIATQFIVDVSSSYSLTDPDPPLDSTNTLELQVDTYSDAKYAHTEPDIIEVDIPNESGITEVPLGSLCNIGSSL